MPKKVAVAVGAMASQDPKAAQRQAKQNMNRTSVPSPAKSTINAEANSTRARDRAAALPGPRASVKNPKTGRPPPLNMAKNETRPAAVLASTLIISCPTPLEMPIAINPLREPIIKHNHKAQADDVLIASAGVKSTVPPEPGAGCHPAGFQPKGGNVSTSDSKTSATRKKSPRERKAARTPCVAIKLLAA